MAKEGWEQGLGPHSKIEWDRGWHTNKVKNGEVHAEKKKNFKFVDTNPVDPYPIIMSEANNG